MSPLRIAELGGRGADSLRDGMLRLLHADYEMGVTARQALPDESGECCRGRSGRSPAGATPPLARSDPGNPYGKQLRQHGEHAREWPATVIQQREDEARVERSRRGLPASCWSPPPKWDQEIPAPQGVAPVSTPSHLAPRQHLGKVGVSASGWVMLFVGSESERELAEDACLALRHSSAGDRTGERMDAGLLVA